MKFLKQISMSIPRGDNIIVKIVLKNPIFHYRNTLCFDTLVRPTIIIVLLKRIYWLELFLRFPCASFFMQRQIWLVNDQVLSCNKSIELSGFYIWIYEESNNNIYVVHSPADLFRWPVVYHLSVGLSVCKPFTFLSFWVIFRWLVNTFHNYRLDFNKTLHKASWMNEIFGTNIYVYSKGRQYNCKKIV